MSSIKEEAIKLIKKGFRIIPCIKKTPHLKKWGNKAISNVKFITDIWDRNNYNIAILTGNKGNNIIVIDCDIKDNCNGLENFINYLNENNIILPPTLTATSGSGGKHFYFKTELPIKNSVSREIKGVDIRANGGCIIAPPSIHPNGNKYVWDNDLGIANLPIKLEELFSSKKSTIEKKNDKIKSVSQQYNDTNTIKVGERNNVLFRLASKLVETGLCYDTLLKTITNENDLKCEEPLTQAEITSIVNCSYNYKNKYDVDIATTNNIFNGSYNTISISIYWLIWYLSLYRCHNTIYISQKEICNMLGIKTTKTIRDNIKPLIETNLIKVKRAKKTSIGYGVYSYKIL